MKPIQSILETSILKIPRIFKFVLSESMLKFYTNANQFPSDLAWSVAVNLFPFPVRTQPRV